MWTYDIIPFWKEKTYQTATEEELLELVKEMLPRKIECKCGKNIWLYYYKNTLDIILNEADNRQLYWVDRKLCFLEHGIFISVNPKNKDGGLGREHCYIAGEDTGGYNAEKSFVKKLAPAENEEQLEAIRWFEERHARRQFPYDNL